jgi:hypothetical protein
MSSSLLPNDINISSRSNNSSIPESLKKVINGANFRMKSIPNSKFKVMSKFSEKSHSNIENLRTAVESNNNVSGLTKDSRCEEMTPIYPRKSEIVHSSKISWICNQTNNSPQKSPMATNLESPMNSMRSKNTNNIFVQMNSTKLFENVFDPSRRESEVSDISCMTRKKMYFSPRTSQFARNKSPDKHMKMVSIERRNRNRGFTTKILVPVLQKPKMPIA